ncbi:hypothetical protein [Brevibacillus centrosporus]|uniref:hypothetical protein n=1 Tax=Brevibacillus centrosporus TaxID=54910 RepID=UPI000B8969E5|nr:hypothetical protein [Brevibacillus centrosporus]
MLADPVERVHQKRKVRKVSVTISTDDLELPCPHCSGKKYVISNEEKAACPKCDGRGVILTALGQTLLHFIKKHS